ncbi:hypothetical protein [Candidatus Vondammii sp. HM_W22]|uniref:hypothetical protein n=1 Tax=Candidatus Vondammii sp. HM_W22 TaxID=2687299 RepID=UPI002E7AF7F2|nr:hypothetical protein [Candidatus Vondammii sp. HM_W22]
MKGGKWIKLGSDLSPALQEYARIAVLGKGMPTLADRFITDAQLKPNTLKQYRQAAATIKSTFSDFGPDQVRPEDVFRFMGHHDSTPNMANRMRSVLKMLFECAVLSGQCAGNLVLPVKRFKEAQKVFD